MTRGIRGARFAARVAATATLVGCAQGAFAGPEAAPRPEEARADASAPRLPTARFGSTDPVLPPHLAMLAGLLPLRSIHADSFLVANPTADGRGVIIGILDSGLDPSLPGLQQTTVGSPKLLDVRDFSREGRVQLDRVRPDGHGSAVIAGVPVFGLERVAAFATGAYWGGVLDERRLGTLPAADVNGDGDADDLLPLVVARASDGWVVLADTDGDGSLANERPVRDFAVAGETLAFWARPDKPAPITMAVNLAGEGERPVLDLVIDNSGHGSHVAGIAAGHDLFGVEGFDGVAPGAQLLGLKISNNARGGVSVTGSMLRAMTYAAEYAARRGMPLVLNLSYGVGNEVEGTATIDSLVDAFALAHPEVLVVISAGNDGPGISTVGLPGSSAHALSVCATFPGVFARPPRPGEDPAPDVLGWWSARGGETAKPDVCAPGLAFSNVPPWSAGAEISGGTSMAAPQIAGGAALLLSAMRQAGAPVRAIDLKRALTATATPLLGTTVLDEGAGVADLPAALRWLRASHQSGIYRVRALPDGANTSMGSAAYRRGGLASDADTLQRFQVTSVGGQAAARLVLRPDAPWVRSPAAVELSGEPVIVPVVYDAAALREPGLYVGTVWARPASDSMAGPAFGLPNTVIVPHGLETPFAVRGMLTPGAVARYFLEVPEDAGGLDVSLTVRFGTEDATLYLFEPNGRPARGGSSAAVGRDSTVAVLAVQGEDLTPGVYEAVVVAPPLDDVPYELRADLPTVSVQGLGTGPSVRFGNRMSAPVSARVGAEIVGTREVVSVHRRDDEAVTLQASPPAWAREMVVDIAVVPATWQRLSDFGVTIIDGDGRIVTAAPLNYADGRLHVGLEGVLRTGPFAVELFPAFADTAGPREWSARVTLSFLRSDPLPLRLLGMSPDEAVVIQPGRTTAFQLEPLPATLDVPAGHDVLLSIVTVPESGPPARRLGAVAH